MTSLTSVVAYTQVSATCQRTTQTWQSCYIYSKPRGFSFSWGSVSVSIAVKLGKPRLTSMCCSTSHHRWLHCLNVLMPDQYMDVLLLWSTYSLMRSTLHVCQLRSMLIMNELSHNELWVALRSCWSSLRLFIDCPGLSIQHATSVNVPEHDCNLAAEVSPTLDRKTDMQKVSRSLCESCFSP